MGVRLTDRLPPWLHEWLDIVVPGGQILLILLAAWLLRLLGRRLLDRVGRRYTLPPEAVVGARRVMTFLIYAAALLLALERMGVSGTVLWTAFTGFAAVGAVAFFAAWSVLSNIFCTMLILTTRPFRLYDHVELLENGEKPGLRGQVVDINLVYTTLRETDDGDGAGTVLQVPNSLFFQRALRRWRGGALPEPKGVGAKRGDPLDV
ncbi:mechanosensitive ion channel domain-containing protein [Luteimonas sp. RC10]|uniref:mechanosensitive ion channel domain-containing protein n=1 Tax=Luteimonas sp. RC10 TaxID=2587035 RepID=UPI00161C62FA